MSEWYLIGVLLGGCLTGTSGVQQADNGQEFGIVESIGCERLTLVYSKHPSKGVCLIRREELFENAMKFDPNFGLICLEGKGKRQ